MQSSSKDTKKVAIGMLPGHHRPATMDEMPHAKRWIKYVRRYKGKAQAKVRVRKQIEAED